MTLAIGSFIDQLASVMNDTNFFSNRAGYLSHDPEEKGVIWGVKSIVVICGYLIFIAVTVAGNICVLVTLAFTTDHKTVYNLYYINLSLADLLVGAIAMPLMLMQDLLGYWPLGVIMCDVWAMMDGIFSSVSFLTLAGVAWERYCAVAKVTVSSYQQSLQRASVIIASIWFIAVAIWLPRQCILRAKLEWELSEDRCHDLELPAHVLVCAIILFYIPMIFMICTYILLYKRLNDHLDKPRQWSLPSRQIAKQTSLDSDNQQTEHMMLDENSGENSSDQHHKRSDEHCKDVVIALKNTSTNGKCSVKGDKERKTHWERRNVRMKRSTARTLGYVMTAFLVCWVPYSIVWPIEAFRPGWISHLACDIVIWLSYINSAINPWVYVYSNAELRKAVFEVWCLRRGR